MTKSVKAIVSVIFAAALAIITVSASSAVSAEKTVSGGNSIKWSLSDDCTLLTITGSGEMADCPSEDLVPWYQARSSIKTVSIDEGITRIGSYAFYHFTALESITIPDSVTSIGRYAFNGCTGIKSLTIPANVIGIEEFAFGRCASLETVNYNAIDCLNMGSVEYPAFYGCGALKNISIGIDVKSIPAYSFGERAGITSVVIPDSVTSIGDRAFVNCTNLSNVTLGDKVEYIGCYAFFGCCSLESIHLPACLKTVEYNTFYGCDRLNRIDFEGSKDDYEKITVLDGNPSLGNADAHFAQQGGENTENAQSSSGIYARIIAMFKTIFSVRNATVINW